MPSTFWYYHLCQCWKNTEASWISEYLRTSLPVDFFFPLSWLIAHPVRTSLTSQGTWITFFFNLILFLSNILDQFACHIRFSTREWNLQQQIWTQMLLQPLLLLAFISATVAGQLLTWGHSEVWTPPVTSTTLVWTEMQGNCGTE